VSRVPCDMGQAIGNVSNYVTTCSPATTRISPRWNGVSGPVQGESLLRGGLEDCYLSIVGVETSDYRPYPISIELIIRYFDFHLI
jgi:hypothetical protein